MKAKLTDNGIMTLYNPGSQTPTKVQVLYMARWRMISFLRVADAKYLSPVMVIMKTHENFIVGDIITIKKVQFQPSTVFKDDEILPILDSDLNHMVILEYQVVEKKAKVGLLFTASPNSNCPENSYWNSLLLIKSCLIKGDAIAESFFREGEKRLQLLRPDCNLLRERGNELFKRHNYSKAILHYDMAKQKDHYDARVWNNSSLAYFFNNEYNKARRDALVALKLDPFNKKAYFRAGRAMEIAGDVNGALDIIEAGLFVCGKCDDLDKLLLQIKGNKEENQNSNINQPKKKISNGEQPVAPVIEAPANGNVKKNLKTKESPLKKVKEPNEIKQDIKPDPPNNDTLIQNRTRLLSFLEGAKMLYEKGKFKNALELFEECNASWASATNNNMNNNQKELEVIRYMINVCKIKLKSTPIEDVKNSLMHSVSKKTFPYPPVLHYWLAIVYETLENQDKVIHHANACLQLLENFHPYSLYWPMTNELINETNPEALKKWFNEGSWRLAPLARCRHGDCLVIQNHSLATIEIYSSDIDFRGYVEVECEELCSICYHPCCWKSMKEQSGEEGQPGKKTDKDFLGIQCFTPDCTGKISCIRIFDENSELKNEIPKDKKDKNTSTSSKQKKKKEKKKANEKLEKLCKLKPRASDVEEIKLEGMSSLRIEGDSGKEEPMMKTIIEKPNGNNVEHVNFEGNFKVLRPNDDLDDYQPLTSKKNKNKKKKKGKPISQINIGEDIDDRFVHNEYLTRLRALKMHRETLESDACHMRSTDTVGIRYLPECILDPDNPFYLPQHLQENPAQLESILSGKLVTSSSSDIDRESIANLLEFMYDWLKAHGPMLVSDSRIKVYISENFPPEAVGYVNQCGGIRNFLLQSFRFALIDEIVCVNEQVVYAQEAAVQLVFDKFKSNKFLISDGHKATKLSHLLDDTKSTCSSNSSLSATLLATVATSSSSTPVISDCNSSPKPCLPSSSTPYKNAALAKMRETYDKPEPIPVEKPSKKVQMKSSSSKKGKSSEKITKENKLKTMDIDAFEEMESVDMGQLFTQQNNNDKGTKTASAGTKLDLFQSDEELESGVPLSYQNLTRGGHYVTVDESRLAFLEAELVMKSEELARMTEENNILSLKNQELSDRFSQIKVKSNVEIAAWKKSTEESLEQTKMAKNNLESYKNQKEGELRKLQGERSRYQDELKANSLKLDSLQITIDQLSASKSQYEEDAKQKSIQLTDQQIRLVKLQESFETSEKRARDAESKYLTMKRDLIKFNLEKTKKRLTAEVNKMRELYLDASEDTLPAKSSFTISINDWEDTICKLNDISHSINDDCQKLIDYIRHGRSLSCLPPGDLQIPSVPDLTVAHLLIVGKPPSDSSTSSSKGSAKTHHSGGGMSFMGITSPFNSVSNNPQSQFRGLASGGLFSLGQLGVTPSSVRSSSSSVCPPNGQLADGLMMGTSSGLPTHRMTLPTSRLRMGHNITEEDFATFPLDAVSSSSISKIMDNEMGHGGSSNSSPITSLSGTNDYAHSYNLGSKLQGASDPNHLFADQISWSFPEDHRKTLAYASNHPLNIQTKEIKRPSSLLSQTLPQSSGLGPVPDLPLVPPPPSSNAVPSLGRHLHHPNSQPTSSPSTCSSSSSSSTSMRKQGGCGAGGSAFGLQSLLEPTSRESRSLVATPPTPTATKPKFQNLRSVCNMDAIGTAPPKVVRPIPRSGALPVTSTGGVVPSASQGMNKEDAMTNSGPYKKLIEGCELKFGNEYPAEFINKAIREVRKQNKNSLSGLALETILEQVEAQLRLHKRIPSKPSVAPWAQITQQQQTTEAIDPQCQGPVRGLDTFSDDHCAICLELLNSSTMPLPCQHVYHIKCIKDWLVRKSDCPICRKFALNSDEYPSLSHNS